MSVIASLPEAPANTAPAASSTLIRAVRRLRLFSTTMPARFSFISFSIPRTPLCRECFAINKQRTHVRFHPHHTFPFCFPSQHNHFGLATMYLCGPQEFEAFDVLNGNDHAWLMGAWPAPSSRRKPFRN